jgi:hypothetical protein
MTLNVQNLLVGTISDCVDVTLVSVVANRYETTNAGKKEICWRMIAAPN